MCLDYRLLLLTDCERIIMTPLTRTKKENIPDFNDPYFTYKVIFYLGVFLPSDVLIAWK